MKKWFAKAWDIYNGLSTPARASLWFLFCNVLQMGLNVLSTPVFTRIMSQEEFGVVSVYNSWRSILMIFTSLNLSYGVFNNAMVKYEDEKTRDEYVSSMQGLYCLITGIFLVLYLCTRSWCNAILKMSTPVVLILFTELFTYPALLFWSSRQRFEFKYRALVVITTVMSLANVGVGIVAVVLSQHKDVARIASSAGVNLLVCVFFLVFQFGKGKKICIPKFWKYALAFNIPLIPHYLSEMVLNQSDRIMIDQFDGASAAANYSIAHSVILLMQLVLQAINATFLPWSYICLKQKKYEDIRRMANLLVLLISGCIFMVMMFVPEIILVFAGQKYMDAIYVIPPLALSVLFMFLYDLFATLEFYYEKNYFVMVASVISACVNVVLNWIFIQIFGYHAAGYTTLFCYAAYALGHYAFYRVVCKKELNGQKVYDEKWLVFLTLAMAALTFVVMLIYDKIWIRYAIALALLVVFAVKHKVILEKFRQMKTPTQSQEEA